MLQLRAELPYRKQLVKRGKQQQFLVKRKHHHQQAAVVKQVKFRPPSSRFSRAERRRAKVRKRQKLSQENEVVKRASRLQNPKSHHHHLPARWLLLKVSVFYSSILILHFAVKLYLYLFFINYFFCINSKRIIIITIILFLIIINYKCSTSQEQRPKSTHLRHSHGQQQQLQCCRLTKGEQHGQLTSATGNVNPRADCCKPPIPRQQSLLLSALTARGDGTQS